MRAARIARASMSVALARRSRQVSMTPARSAIRHAVRAHGSAGAIADTTGNVVPELACGGIVGQWQPGIGQRMHDEIPVH